VIGLRSPSTLEPLRRGAARGGFTLIEVAVVVMVVGILAGIAIPSLRDATLRAEATSLVSEARTISQAAYAYLTEHGTFPPSSFGGPPAELEPYLPDNFDFSYEGGVTYSWFTLTLPNDDNVWQSRNLGLFMINYSSRPELAQAMQAHTGTYGYWGPSVFYFIYPG